MAHDHIWREIRRITDLKKLGFVLFSPSRSKMPNFGENRIALLYTRQQRLINDEKFLLLYNLNFSASADFPYWTYDNFDLDSLSDEECKAEFRFYRNDIYQMLDVLQLPDEMTCYNGFHVDGSKQLTLIQLSYIIKSFLLFD